jgi:GNAT superfamily N-acetyltransferase
MSYHIKDFSAEDILSAVELFLQSYMREKEVNALMPDKIVTDPQLIIHSLNSQAKNPGVAVFSNGTLVAYMLTGATFTFKNQKAAMVPEYGHSAIEEDRRELYRLMYMKLSSSWIEQDIHLHIIGHFAHDEILNDILFQLGFGAILSEKLRDLSPVARDPNLVIKVENDLLKIFELEKELRQYARTAPIFIKKNTESEAIVSDLTNHLENGDVFLVFYDNDIPAGYFSVGTSNNTREGFLLQDANTAQVKLAFIKPSFRGKGAGTALLNEAIKWARDNGFERVFVEHETANHYGGKFWEKHFSSYLYFSIRYIDNTI